MAKVRIEGESDFNDAIKGLSDTDKALVRLIESEKKLAASKAAEEKFKAMSEAEKDAFLASAKLTEEQAKLEQQQRKSAAAADQASDANKKQALTLTDLKSGIDMTIQALGKVQEAYGQTIGKTVAYAEQVRDLGRISGASTEETSRLIQTADDLKVEYETLQQAAKALANHGIALTTEELAKASDEYLAIQNAGMRAEYATTKFGRAGLELTKVLETGGATLREMADAQGENLILTEEQVKQARQLEKANDDLEDSMAGLNYQISLKLIPSVTAFIDLWGDLLALDSKDWFYDGADAAANFINRVFNGKKDVHDFAEEARYLEGKFDNMADAAKNAALAQSALADKFREIGPVTDEFNSDLGRSSLAVQDINTNMRSLINDAMRPLTTEMLYQKAAAGLDEDAALDLAKSMGLISTESYNALVKLRDIRSAADANKDGFIDAAEAANGYTDAVKALANGDYLVKIRADFSDLDAALAKAAELNRLGTAGIKGPTFSWTPPTGGGTTPKETTPANGETGATSTKTNGTEGLPEYGGKQAEGGVYEVDRPTIFEAGDKGRETAIFIPDGKKLVSAGSTQIVNIYGWQGDGRSLAAELERQERVRRLME